MSLASLLALACQAGVPKPPTPDSAESATVVNTTPAAASETTPSVPAPEATPEVQAPPRAPWLKAQHVIRTPRVTLWGTPESKVTAERVALHEVPAFFEASESPPGKAIALAAGEPVTTDRVELDFSPALTDGKGIVAVRVGDGQPVLRAFSDLSPMLKVGKKRGLVWLTSLATGEPVPRAEVTIVRCKRRISGRTDESGMYTFELPHSAQYCDTYALVKHGADESFVAPYDGRDGQPHMDASNSTRHPDAHGDGVAAVVFTDRSWYRPGERVRFYGTARDARGSRSRPLQGKVRVRMSAEGDKPRFVTLPLSPAGMFSGELSLPTTLVEDAPLRALQLGVFLPSGKLIGGDIVYFAEVPAHAEEARNQPRPPPQRSAEELAAARAAWRAQHEAELEKELREPYAPYVRLVKDKESYEVGDVAHLRIASPFARAIALVTVERDDVLAHFFQRVEGPMPTLDLPLEEHFAPMAAVTVSLAAAEQPDFGAALAAGDASLSIGAASYHLDVQARVSGDAASAHIEVRDAQGRPVASELVVQVNDDELEPGAVDPYYLLFTRDHDVTTYDARFLAIGCDQTGPSEPMLPPENQAMPSASDGVPMLLQVRTDGAGVATVALPPRPTRRGYTLHVLAASPAGAMGMASTPIP